MLCAHRLLLVEQSYTCVRLRRLLGLGSVVPVDFCGWCSHFGAATAMPAGAGGPPAPAAVPGVPGVPGPMQCQVDFLSSGCRRRSASGGFDWRDVAPVAVPFACGLFSSAGKFYRSSSVFEVLDQVSLPPTSGRSFIGGASAWFCLLLWLTAVSLACGLAFAVLRGGGGFPREY